MKMVCCGNILEKSGNNVKIDLEKSSKMCENFERTSVFTKLFQGTNRNFPEKGDGCWD